MQVTAGMEHPQVVFQDLRAAEDRRAPSPQVQEELFGRGAHRHGHQATTQGGGPQQRGHMGPGGGGRLRSPGCHRPRYAAGPEEQTRGAGRFHPVELKAWQTKTVSAARINRNPVPLIAPKYSFTGIPWWTTWVTEAGVREGIPGHGLLAPDPGLKDAILRRGVTAGLVKPLMWHSFRVFIPDCAFQMGIPRERGVNQGDHPAGQAGPTKAPLEVLCDRRQLEDAYVATHGTPKPRLEFQGSDGYLKKQWHMIAKSELGYIPAKHIVSALPEEGERPSSTHKKITVDGWDREDEEEVRSHPTSRRQLERLHLTFRTTVLQFLRL